MTECCIRLVDSKTDDLKPHELVTIWNSCELEDYSKAAVPVKLANEF